MLAVVTPAFINTSVGSLNAKTVIYDSLIVGLFVFGGAIGQRNKGEQCMRIYVLYNLFLEKDSCIKLNIGPTTKEHTHSSDFTRLRNF